MADGTTVGQIKYDLDLDDKKFQQSASNVSNSLGRLGKGFNSLNPGVRALGLSLGAFLGGSALLGFLKSSVQAFNDSQRILAQTNAVIQSTGAAAGYSAQQIQEMGNQIQKTTPISDEAARQGMNMLLTFTKIGHDTFPAATQAVLDMSTAMNGGAIPTGQELAQTAIQVGKALQDPILGVTALRRVGVNFNQTQQDMIKKMVDTGHAMEAQKYILGELSREFGGSAAAQAQTFAGQLAMLENKLNDLQEQIGAALVPALSYLVDGLSNAATGANYLIIPFQVLASAMVGLILIAKELGIVISTVIASVIALASGNVDLMKGVIKQGMTDMILEGANAQQSLNKVWKSGSATQTKTFLKGLQDQDDAMSASAKKMMKDLANENEAYADASAKRKKDFDQNMADLIWAHQDKVKTLKSQLDDENLNFASSMADMKATFASTMQDLKDSHDEKVKSIMDQMDEETAKGRKADKSKLADLEEQLAAENLAYQKAQDKQTADENAKEAKAQADHDKQIADYQTQLNQENAILSAHQADVDAIKDKARVDDITRLQQQNADENAEALKQHEKKLSDIREQGGAEGDAYGGALNAGIAGQAGNINATLAKIASDGTNTMAKGMADGSRQAASSMVDSFYNGIIDAAKKAIGFAIKVTNPAVGLLSDLFKIAGLPHLATGIHNFPGGLALVGEKGPELMHVPRGADIYPNDKLGSVGSELSGGGAGKRDITQNITVNVGKIVKEQDIQSLGNELGFRALIMP